jgi:hypothetical protein
MTTSITPVDLLSFFISPTIIQPLSHSRKFLDAHTTLTYSRYTRIDISITYHRVEREVN